MAKRKSAGSSSGQAQIVAPNGDRRQDERGAQGNAILDDDHTELRLELDGEVERTATGFNAATATRKMFIPYDRTCDPAVALAICKAHGLLLAKLAGMEAAAATIVYLTTFPTMETEN